MFYPWSTGIGSDYPPRRLPLGCNVYGIDSAKCVCSAHSSTRLDFLSVPGYKLCKISSQFCECVAVLADPYASDDRTAMFGGNQNSKW